MDVKQYIESGSLEQYCLGLLTGEEQAFVIQISMLYPEVKGELTAIELALEKIAVTNAIQPNGHLKNKILSALDGLAGPSLLDIHHLPPTGKESDHESWLLTLDHLIAEEPAEDFFFHVLREDERISQTLVIIKSDVPEETHDDKLESFFILKGVCECVIDGELFRLQPGDFLEIPLHKPHDIKIISPYVVGILQHVAV